MEQQSMAVSSADSAAAEALVFTEVSAAFPDGSEVLHHITFSAAPGQIIGITGAVACGKTTLGRLLIGEIPYTGSIRIGEHELRTLNDAQRSEQISYLGHDPELMNDTLAENIRLGKEGEIAPVLEAVCLTQEVREMPDGENTLLGSGGVRLSGGQQARAALARTLFHARAILVLDDPFSAVDRLTEQEILQHLRQLYPDRILLIFSHRLYQFPNFDGVLFLQDGAGHFGTHAQLMQEEPDYASLYREQTKGGADHEA